MSLPVRVVCRNVVVIGSGVAGWNAADCLLARGVPGVALMTEDVHFGTSRNTGSDKQTYYKLNLCGSEPDSVRALADTLWAGGSRDGDTALAEAALSVRCFMKLTELGVPFPANEYGEYVGYKTDHDPKKRATSAGPLTSRYMTEALEAAARARGVEVMDGLLAFRILRAEGRTCGVLALDTRGGGLVAVASNAVIAATGGPSGIYETSVYPESQHGMTGMLAEAAPLANIAEWQYGLASVKFRWNVSGTYQQVLPRYVSVRPDGTEREFLPEYFGSPKPALQRVFLKGYQWPFDAAKLSGSSVIDVIVHTERKKGNRVYLDFTRDPAGFDPSEAALGTEAYAYLKSSGALCATPYRRLAAMNPAAASLYAAHGIDLEREPLEIAVCAQHSNGGVRVDENWQTELAGLYAAGEAAGTFGVYRPGGTALNAAMAGSLRAAQHIADHPRPTPIALCEEAEAQLAEEAEELAALKYGRSNLAQLSGELRRSMSEHCAHMREGAAVAAMAARLGALRVRFKEQAVLAGAGELAAYLRLADSLASAHALCCAVRDGMPVTGSRGSALYLADGGARLAAPLNFFQYRRENEAYRDLIQVTEAEGDGFVSRFVKRRPVPNPDTWFESVWRARGSGEQ